MQKVTNVTIGVALAKDGFRKDKKTKWYKHSYKFESSENWYSHFVKEKTPLYPVGTVVKEMTYEMDQYGGNIKSMVVGSMPAPSDEAVMEGAKATSVALGKAPVDYGKQHPIWMCLRWATDLQLSRMDRMYPKFEEKEGSVFPDLRKLADEVVANGWYIFTRTKAFIGGKDPGKAAEQQAAAGKGEPKQEPDFEPPPEDDSIPF